MKSLDKTRIIDSASGWFRRKKSDVESLHVYFGPVDQKEYRRPIVLSEFGGYSLRIKGRTFTEKNYGYRDMESQEHLTEGLKELYERDIIPYIGKGLCAAVYTQLSDVEDETNGLFTYDRQVLKPDAAVMRDIARRIREANCENSVSSV